MSKSKMKKLVIDRTKWARGNNSDGNKLLCDKDNKKAGKMCCLGFYALSCGFDENSIEGASDMPRYDDDWGAKASTVWLSGYNNPERGALVSANDKLHGKKREARIIKLFAKHNVEVTFIN